MATSSIDGDRKMTQFTVAIIGGGFAGATLAAQLLRKSGGNVSVILIERSARPGRGVAYGTPCSEHLLNVPAKNMSVYPDDPEHFLRWSRLNYDPDAKLTDFLPRQVYGQYVAFALQQEIERNPGRFTHVQGEAVAVTRIGDTAEIRLLSGRTLSAAKVVLALGNFPPGDPRLPGKTPHSRRYVADPWAAGALGDVAQDQSILLVGSGLTSVDVTIALRTRGFRGTIHTLSRRGLLPQNHQAAASWPAFWDQRSPRTARGLLRLIRTQVRAAEERGSGWRAVIDSLRPFTQKIWGSLPRQEQRRFLRHVRPYWEVHRHRVAPEIGALLAAEMLEGRMEIHAGRITAYREDVGGADLEYRDRKTGGLARLRVSRVINCTGPEVDCRKIENRLLTSLMTHKMVRPDPLFLGLDSSEYGALIDANGELSDFLYAVGPARKGNLWESTAVPEIRVQVSEMATLLVVAREQEDDKSILPDPAANLQSALRLVS
jgi:uncharacterized NAD(P)/FAD-binding protein YdhS